MKSCLTCFTVSSGPDTCARVARQRARVSAISRADEFGGGPHLHGRLTECPTVRSLEKIS